MSVVSPDIVNRVVRSVIKMTAIVWAIALYAGRLDAQSIIVRLATISKEGQINEEQIAISAE